MRVLVPIKQVLDYNVRPKVMSDGSGIDLSSAKMSMNPFDEIGVEEAVRLKEAGKCSEVVVVSIGTEKVTEVIRSALAIGADRGIFVEVVEQLEPLSVAKILEKIVAEEQPSLVILGRQAIDDDCCQTGQMLSALLKWGIVTFASTLDVSVSEIAVSREIDGGRQTVVTSLPAIVTTDLRLNQPRYASLANVMKAKKKPLTKRAVAEFGIDIRPRLKKLKTLLPATRVAGIRVRNVDELLSSLRSRTDLV